MKITEKIEFIEDLPLSKQSLKFEQWYIKNIQIQITENTIPYSIDEFNRPKSFILTYLNFVVTVIWLYIYESKSNWSCKDILINIQENNI
jgi:hypothetical protein